MKRILYIILIGLVFSLGSIFYANNLVSKTAKFKVYDKVDDIPEVKVGLLLGTSKYLSSGYENLYFKYRIQAATALYRSGKIKRIIVSGDNGSKEYDEASDMKYDLIANGIDSNHIYLDYAGFRTFDSMKRLKEIFGQKKAIIISQKFHNERAIYIGEKLDMEVYGFNANDVSQYYGLRTNLREYLARVKMLLDFVIGVEPRFLGEKVEIN